MPVNMLKFQYLIFTSFKMYPYCLIFRPKIDEQSMFVY